MDTKISKKREKTSVDRIIVKLERNSMNTYIPTNIGKNYQIKKNHGYNHCNEHRK